MSEKCEWKDGKFKPCVLNLPFSLKMGDMYIGGICSNFCPLCGADIRKPEPEVIIKKSNKTWVARYNGIDYLNLRPFNEYANEEKVEGNFLVEYEDVRYWEPISEIEVTDEIAKLRPMVVCKPSSLNPCILIHVDNNSEWVNTVIQPKDSVNRFKKGAVRIATVKDLEEYNA